MDPNQVIYDSVIKYDFHTKSDFVAYSAIDLANNMFKCNIGTIVVNEFKKFMFLNKLSLGNTKRVGTSSKD